jgi:CRP-like cAMP-binding protein
MVTVARLSVVRLFAGLPPAVMERLLPWLEERRVGVGEVLIREGEPSASLFMLVEGDALICKRVAGSTEALVARVGMGDHLGEIDLVDAQSAAASVIMSTDGVVLVLDVERLRRMLVTDRPLFSHVAKALYVDLADKVRQTNLRVRQTIAWGLEATGELTG